MFCKEQRQPGVWGAGAPASPGIVPCNAPDAATTSVLVAIAATMPVAQGASAEVRSKRGSHGWGSSSDVDDNYQGASSSGQRLLTPWISCSSQPPPPPDDRVPTTPPVSLPPGFQSPPVSDADSTLTGFRAVDCPLRLRVDDAFACYREDDRDWMDAWRTQQSCSVSRHAALISHLFSDREPAPEFLDQSPRLSSGPALRSDQRNRRQTDKLQILSWNPGPAKGSDPSMQATHLNGPWHVVFAQEEVGFVTDSSLAENFHVITQHHCAVLLNKDTFTRDLSCTPIQVPCLLRYSSWAVEGMVVTGKFRKAPDPSCAYLTVANVHIKNEWAKRRSVCIDLLVLIRDICMKLGAAILTGDFNKGAERELASSAPTDQRRISPLEAALSRANVLWPTSGVTPLRASHGEPHGCTLPECCGFVMLPESQNQWLIMRNRSIHPRRPCGHWVEDHGPNMALRAMATPRGCGM